MADRIGRCHVCGKDIMLSDLKAGRAITLLKRRYCRDCTVALESSLPRAPVTASSPSRIRGRLLVVLATGSASLLLLLYLLNSLGRRG